MTDLPPGWAWATLDELAAPIPRAITDGPFGSNLKTQHYTEEGPRVIRLQNIGFGEFIDEPAHISKTHYETLQAHSVSPGDLVVASLGEDLPRSCIIPESVTPAIVKADCIRVRLHPGVSARYVNYALQRPDLKRAVADQIHGVGRPRLGMKGIRSLAVPISPRSEQDRIVATIEEHLSRLDAADASVMRTQRNVDRLRRAAVDQLLTSRDWPWTTLGEIADLKGGVTKNAGRQEDPALVDVPYLRVANVQRGRLDLTQVTTIRVSPDKAKALRLQRGDVLFNEGGDRDKLGRGWVWEDQIADCIHQNHVFRARLQTDRFDPYFVSTHANTWGQRWFEQHGRQTTNLASISLSVLKQFPVPAPSLAEQTAVMVDLDQITGSIDRLQDDLIRHVRRAEALRHSILSAAFSGRFVPQDPDDEPASVLLGRIRAERASVRPISRKKAAP